MQDLKEKFDCSNDFNLLHHVKHITETQKRRLFTELEKLETKQLAPFQNLFCVKNLQPVCVTII